MNSINLLTYRMVILRCYCHKRCFTIRSGEYAEAINAYLVNNFSPGLQGNMSNYSCRLQKQLPLND